VARDLSGWRHRLETAEKRAVELADRRAATEDDLHEAMAAPEDIAIKREEMDDAIATATARRTRAVEALAGAEAALRTAQTAEREAERAWRARRARAAPGPRRAWMRRAKGARRRACASARWRT
jgi:chromosome segregation protein